MVQYGFELLKILLPTITAIAAVYFTYRYGLKKFQFEEKNREHKKIRDVLASIMIIWDEFIQLDIPHQTDPLLHGK